MRLTRSIDIFSLGCIFYYVLTGGEHPFGGRYEREMNILKGAVSLDRLDGLGEEALEVQDLIVRMVATDPRERSVGLAASLAFCLLTLRPRRSPSAEAVLLHPFFWNAQKRLLFICDASDRFEIMDRDPPAQTLISLELDCASVVGDDWQKSIDRTLLENLGKYRKYDGKSVRDLLRVLRNKVTLLIIPLANFMLTASRRTETPLPRPSRGRAEEPRRSSRRVSLVFHHTLSTSSPPRLRHSCDPS